MTVKLGIQTRSEVAEHQRANWETVSNLSLNRCIFLRIGIGIGIGIEVQNFKFCQVALSPLDVHGSTSDMEMQEVFIQKHERWYQPEFRSLLKDVGSMRCARLGASK